MKGISTEAEKVSRRMGYFDSEQNVLYGFCVIVSVFSGLLEIVNNFQKG